MTNYVEKIKNHLTETGISQNELAQRIRISGGALSSYLNGTYKGNISNVEARIEEYLKRETVKATEFVEAPQFIETATAKQIFKACDFAQIANCINVVYGASGVGKTKALQEYERTHTNVVLVTASPSRASLSEILYELALEIGLTDAPKRKGSSARLIRKKLQGTNSLVIIDEADHLPYDALEELRIMQEETGIGLVLVGNDKVYNRLRGGASQAHEFARLWSRIAKRVSIQKCKKNDVLAIAEAWNLSNDDDAKAVMTDIASRAGGLRMLTQSLRLAGMVAKGKNQLITADLIQTAYRDLQGE